MMRNLPRFATPRWPNLSALSSLPIPRVAWARVLLRSWPAWAWLPSTQTLGWNSSISTCKKPAAIRCGALKMLASRYLRMTFFSELGLTNNGNLINHMGSDFPFNRTQKYIVFDSPAGNEPSRSTFLSHCDIVFVPTSVGDADVFATLKYLDEINELLVRQKSNVEGPTHSIVLLPNMVDSREEFNELRNHFSPATRFTSGSPCTTPRSFGVPSAVMKTTPA